MKVTSKYLFGMVLILNFLILICFLPAIAEADQDYAVPGINYELPDEKEYEVANATASGFDTFFYGSKSMGTLRLIGAISKLTTKDDYTEYGVNGPVSLYYTYGGGYRETDLGKWYVDDDAMGKVGGYDFGAIFKGVGHGCILVEESEDTEEWTLVQEPKLNYFTDIKKDSDAFIYTIPEDAAKNGRYYRVLVAYRFCKKTANGFIVGGQFEYKKCIELYRFYVSSEKNYITLNDMGNGSPLQDQASTETGFIIRKNGSQAKVNLVGSEEECFDFEYFTEPGEYTIEVTTKLGLKYSNTIIVTNGIDFKPLDAVVYKSEKDKGFPMAEIPPNTVFGGRLTSLLLATPKGTEVAGLDSAYGITGKSASLYLQLNKNADELGNGWAVNYDKWGKNIKDKIDGISTGEIGKGALIIEKSRDGINWVNAENGVYRNGLYNTDMATNYGQAESVQVYTPSGDDILNGTYYRVLFAYQVYNSELKDYRDYVELYPFYLCSDNLGAVTIHNLSLAETLEETLKEELKDADKNTIEAYQKTESMESGSYTTTGFRIDKTLNPTVRFSVIHNGVSTFTDDYADTFEATGKYDISMVSVIGSNREAVIYVDRSTPEEAMQLYFGEGFISGKRIFSEGEYPVYEGGKTSYRILGVDENVLPLYGQIINQSTGTITTIEQDHSEKTDVFSEPGFYKAVFSTSKAVFEPEENIIGDARVFTFQFQIIPEGTAPGPVVNQNSLENYRHSTVIDANPIYYGLTFSSATKGNITLAFASKEAAVNYAYGYEEGTVEDQGNGSFRYVGSFQVRQKTKYDNAWKLTDAMTYFAKEAVQRYCFDMSDEFTYLSLTDDIIKSTANLRQLELPQSVTIFADDEQKEQLTSINALPLLNDKPYAYLDPATGEISRGNYHFEFVTDQYGIDSHSVTITDSQGATHNIVYSKSVGQQLQNDNCASGVVTVHEETIYGDFAEYQAVYIAPDDNSTSFRLIYTEGDKMENAVIDKANADFSVVADTFQIEEPKDPWDPYALIVVRHGEIEEAYVACEAIEKTWSEPGDYSISCVNRMGYGYTIKVFIEKSDNTTEDASEVSEDTDQSVVIARRTENSELGMTPIPEDKGEPEEDKQQFDEKTQTEESTTEPEATETTPEIPARAELDNSMDIKVILAASICMAFVIAVIVLLSWKKKISSSKKDTERGGKNDHE